MASKLDRLDREILNSLQQEGRISNVELARRIELSPPATHVRLKRLEEDGYVEEYVARLDRRKLGYHMLCYVNLSFVANQVDQVDQLRSLLRSMPEVLECSFVTGEYDYLLKVALHDQEHLERFIVEQLSKLPGIERISTNLVITEIKSSLALSILDE